MPYRTIRIEDDERGDVVIIDQRKLPHVFETETIGTVDGMFLAIRDMHVRGAGLVGASAGAGMWLAARDAPDESDAFDEAVAAAGEYLKTARPTAANLENAVSRQLAALATTAATVAEKRSTVRREAIAIMDEDADFCRRIGAHGLALIEEAAAKKKDGGPVNVLTHCNAGWLAFVDHGSATAPIYAAHDAGINVHVWVDETRPRNQGASLTAWELAGHGVPHTVVADNAGGHLMQRGMVDLCVVGCDRATREGDCCNKIGTYLKALAARDNDVPFYFALPSSTFDWSMRDGVRSVPVERRDPDEVRYAQGLLCDDETKEERLARVLLCPKTSPALNHAFDVTPARLVSKIVTERGVCDANEESILALFPEIRERS